MSRIYNKECRNGNSISLCEWKDNPNGFPYLILRNNRTLIAICDSMCAAYREYNAAIVKEGM